MRTCFLLLAAAAATSALGTASAQTPAFRLNDTGQTSCIVDRMVSSDCAQSGQDAASGRDVAAPGEADGRAGFVFEKVAADGRPLPPDATDWACTRDRVTGLLWEVKAAAGLHGVYDSYTMVPTDRGAWVQTFVDAVNAERLCGVTGWRVPNRVELLSIVDYGIAEAGMALDTGWMGPATTLPYWTSTRDTDPADYHIYVDFYSGSSSSYLSIYNHAVRLVQGGAPKPLPRRYRAQDAQVTDTLAGLIWQRCSAGQTWDGQTCTGEATRMTWDKAATWALEQAQATGVPWRLPNIKELVLLTQGAQRAPVLDPRLFPATAQASYWSATYYTPDRSMAWAVNFVDGKVAQGFRPGQPMPYRYAVRLVRDVPGAR